MIKNCYIHIPFCEHICSYCDFCKLLYHHKFVDPYLDHLEKEIQSIYQHEVLDTIYIGGGTPSSLSLKELEKLFGVLDVFQRSKDIEFTIECNFSSITLEKLKLFKRVGITRISFGLESVIEKNLSLLDRYESKKRAKDVVSLCQNMGFLINIDLMYAIPNEKLQELEYDLDFILSLNVDHISTYSLIIEDHTKLSIENYAYIDEDLDHKMYQLICDKLHHYHHYEISNFAKRGCEAKHNLCYWKNKQYYGFGLGASSYVGNKRITNTRSINHYLQDDYILDWEVLSESDIMDNEMILGLRLLTGVNKKEFYSKYGVDIEQIYPIDELVSKKLILNTDCISIPIDKIYISNEVLIHFIRS